MSCHQPANRSAATRVGISTAGQPPGVAGHHRQHRQLRRLADLAEPDRQLDRREPEIALRDLARLVARARRPGPAADTPAAAPRPDPDSIRIERVQPIRSAITVAGIVGYACSSSRIRGSTASTIDPAALRSYLGGPSRAQRRLHRVPRDPQHPRDLRDRHLSARRSRRISAQSSTLNTPSSPGSTASQTLRKVVRFRLPRPGQFSRAVDMG